jgi:hypothetical protein
MNGAARSLLDRRVGRPLQIRELRYRDRGENAEDDDDHYQFDERKTRS